MIDRKLVLLACTLVLGCQSESADPVVAVPRTVARVTLQLGSIEEAGPTLFGRIGGLLADPGKRIFIADYQASEIRVFSVNGDHSFSFGGDGSGPGEIREPCCLAWGPDGRLWVRDGSNHRYSAYRIDERAAEFVEQRKMAHSDVNFWAPLSFMKDGTLVDVGHRVSETGNLELVRFFLAPDGRKVQPELVPTLDPSEIGQYSVMRNTERGQDRWFMNQPFGPRQVVAHGPEGSWSHGVSSDYALTLITPAATIEIVRDLVGPQLSAREETLATERLEAQLQVTGVRRNDLPFGIPVRKTPIREIFYDTEGMLWVERNVPDGQPRVADVWSTTGQLKKEIEWPSDISLTLPGWVGSSSALGLRTDSLGVQYVVRIEY